MKFDVTDDCISQLQSWINVVADYSPIDADVFREHRIPVDFNHLLYVIVGSVDQHSRDEPSCYLQAFQKEIKLSNGSQVKLSDNTDMNNFS